jgi:hypothetical protein
MYQVSRRHIAVATAFVMVILTAVPAGATHRRQGFHGLQALQVIAITDPDVFVFGSPYETWVNPAGMDYEAAGPEILRISFSGECHKMGPGTMRIMLVVDKQEVQPGGYNRQFCSTAATPSTHTATWFHRTTRGGKHNVAVYFLLTGGTATIDDYVLEVVTFKPKP